METFYTIDVLGWTDSNTLQFQAVITYYKTNHHGATGSNFWESCSIPSDERNCYTIRFDGDDGHEEEMNIAEVRKCVAYFYK